MTWQRIARKEVSDAMAPRAVKGLLGLFMLSCVLIAYVLPVLSDGAPSASTSEFATTVASWPLVPVLLPLLGILLGYKSVATERESGTLVLLLSLPYSRREIAVGKYLGRAAILAVTVAVAFTAAAWLVAYPFGSLAVLSHLALTGLTVLLGAIFLGIGMALSAVSRTELRATLSSFAVFVLFAVLWEALRDGAENLLVDGEFADWVLFVYALEPTTLYARVVEVFLGDGVDPVFGESVPWYGSEWLALALFLAWVCAPLVVGYLFFQRVEL
jgi:ABC-2 type transport system permease protein